MQKKKKLYIFFKINIPNDAFKTIIIILAILTKPHVAQLD